MKSEELWMKWLTIVITTATAQATAAATTTIRAMFIVTLENRNVCAVENISAQVPVVVAVVFIAFYLYYSFHRFTCRNIRRRIFSSSSLSLALSRELSSFLYVVQFECSRFNWNWMANDSPATAVANRCSKNKHNIYMPMNWTAWRSITYSLSLCVFFLFSRKKKNKFKSWLDVLQQVDYSTPPLYVVVLCVFRLKIPTTARKT